MNQKLWDVYLSIANKIETGGLGNDDQPIESFEEFVRIFAKFCPPDKYPRVLNIGAGAGAETKLLKDAGYDVVAITLGKDNIKIGKDKYSVNLNEMDMHYLQFEPESFDAIFMIQTQEHALSSWIFALEMRFVLRVGGRIFTDLPSPVNPDMMKTIWHTEVLYPDQIEILMSKAGFSNIVGNLGSHDRYRYIFEKLPPGTFETWWYLQHIYKLRLSLFLTEGARKVLKA